jgi:recombination DNA repair RAD52 pathway protein
MNQSGVANVKHRPTIVFSDVGFGDAVDYSGSEISTHELAMKEAVSDGVKRALKNLGDQFGLGLYDAERRADVERRRGLTTDAGIKREVFRIAKERLGVDKPSAKQVAEVFGRKATDLNEPTVLRQILVDEGAL